MVFDRRAFLVGSGAGVAGLAGGVLLGGGPMAGSDADGAVSNASTEAAQIPFRDVHQAGIATPPQRHAVFASFDVVRRERMALAALMSTWTELADQMALGKAVALDTGEASGMGPSRLTVTFGFGGSLFDDACVSASARPAGLIDLPEFPGDQIDDIWSGGDLLLQVCADAPTIVSHALRQLRRTGQGTVRVRWSQSGFLPQAPGSTPRNLFGQVDGTANPTPGSSEFDDLVWATGGPAWMIGGTYLATRRIRMMLTMWDRMGVDVQEATIGRRRSTGAPLTGGSEFTPPDLDATRDGAPVIPSGAHVRIARTAGPGMLRRGYSYDNGPRPTGPDAAITGQVDHSQHGQMDHTSMMAAMDDHDAGLFFAAYVRDPATQFVPTQQALSRNDALGHFLAYTSSGLWAIPAGALRGAIAAELFA